MVAKAYPYAVDINIRVDETRVAKSEEEKKMREMDYFHVDVVAKRIAPILEENGATVKDMEEIFRRIKANLTVHYFDNSERPCISHGIKLPKEPYDSDGIGDE